MEQQISPATIPPPNQSVYIVSPKHKKIGLFFLIGPFIGLVVVLFMYAIYSFVFLNLEPGAPSIAVNITKLILGVLGLIFAMGILIGIPLGILYLNKKELVDGSKYDGRSGNKELSVIPEEIKAWNWGAAGLTWIWGVYHSVWISLLFFIPLVNIVMIIILGMKGNEWAWKAQKWESVEKFLASQRKWRPWGIAFVALMILMQIPYLL